MGALGVHVDFIRLADHVVAPVVHPDMTMNTRDGAGHRLVLALPPEETVARRLGVSHARTRTPRQNATSPAISEAAGFGVGYDQPASSARPPPACTAAAGRITTDDLVMFLPFALVVFVNLLETQWADRHADMATGRNTLAARAPATLLRGLAAAATVAAYTLLLLLAPAPVPSLVAGMSMAALPLSVYAWQLTRHDTPGPAVLAMLVLLAVQLLSWTHLAC